MLEVPYRKTIFSQNFRKKELALTEQGSYSKGTKVDDVDLYN